jgi:hypothetical protein
MSSKTQTRTIYRDSETGRITTPDYAKAHPSTTEKERVRVPAPPPPPKKK